MTDTSGARANSYVAVPKSEHCTDGILRYDSFVALLFKDMGGEIPNRLHAAVGISGEAGELLDAVKKNWAYNKPIDMLNVVEELGDLLFYIHAMLNVCGLEEQQVIQANADKLSKRYASMTYSDDQAQDRADKPKGE